MDADRRFPLGWLILALVVAAGVVALYWWKRSPARFDTGVTIVGAKTPAPTSSVSTSAPMEPPAAAFVASPDIAAAHAMRAYPMLYDVRIACADGKCTLHGMIRPPTGGQPELDKRQEMLLGGLATTLARDGYRLEVPFDMEEIESNRFRLTAKVMPQPS